MCCESSPYPVYELSQRLYTRSSGSLSFTRICNNVCHLSEFATALFNVRDTQKQIDFPLWATGDRNVALRSGVGRIAYVPRSRLEMYVLPLLTKGSECASAAVAGQFV